MKAVFACDKYPFLCSMCTTSFVFKGEHRSNEYSKTNDSKGVREATEAERQEYEEHLKEFQNS